MAIKAAFRQRYIVGITKRHAQHKQQMLRVFHKIRSHPACYRPGFKPSRAGVPKSIPKQPAGLTKKASGFWSTMKKGWSWVKSKFHQHKGKIVDAAKKHGAAAGRRLIAAGGRAASNLADRAIGVAESNLAHYTSKVENKISGLASRAEAHISKYDKPKQGEGWLGDKIRAGFRGGVGRFARRVINRGMRRRGRR